MPEFSKLLITGGAGFIGANLIHWLIEHTDHHVVNIDKLTYAGNLASLRCVESNPRYCFEQVDIADKQNLNGVLERHRPAAIIHLAAESHVDRSIEGPAEFIQTNIVGTYHLLELTREYLKSLSPSERSGFRFLHVSTDEVYGALATGDPAFRESTAYDPRSPYSASKAASDHLVRAWHNTYRLPIAITACSNNYGPYQHPEKLIPQIILRAIHGLPILIYGSGNQIRDWIHVSDHIQALLSVLESGQTGETYNIGGKNEWRNIDVVHQLCDILDREFPVADNPHLSPDQRQSLVSYRHLMEHVEDRPGHDFRYALDPTKIEQEIQWEPQTEVSVGFRNTVQWYLKNPQWWSTIFDKSKQNRYNSAASAPAGKSRHACR